MPPAPSPVPLVPAIEEVRERLSSVLATLVAFDATLRRHGVFVGPIPPILRQTLSENQQTHR